MDKLKTLFIRSIIVFFLFSLASNLTLSSAQGNCLQFPEDSGERKACEICYTNEYKQGSRESLMLLDSAIAMGPNYAWAYYQKSVPYFKRGYLLEGIKLLNKAVELDPQSHLCYRAYWYYSHKSYQACINDLELYYSSYGGYVEFTPGGEHEMRLLLGMSYAEMGDLDSAINVISEYLMNPENEMHLRSDDYYVLGVLYYRNNEYDKAAATLNEQIKINPRLAEAYYYLGLVKKRQLDDEGAIESFQQATNRQNGTLEGYSRKVLGIPSINELKQNRGRIKVKFVD